MRKTDQDLHKEMSLCGFNVTLKTIEVRSRGVLATFIVLLNI